MERLYAVIGNLAALAGLALCLVAGVARLAGSYYVGGYEAMTLLLGGMAIMVFACLAKLQQLLSTTS